MSASFSERLADGNPVPSGNVGSSEDRPLYKGTAQ